MNKPMISIVETLIQRHYFTSLTLEEWEDGEIERFAPGFLALEAQGRAVDFELANLWNEDDLQYIHYPLELKIRYRETGKYW